MHTEENWFLSVPHGVYVYMCVCFNEQLTLCELAQIQRVLLRIAVNLGRVQKRRQLIHLFSRSWKRQAPETRNAYSWLRSVNTGDMVEYIVTLCYSDLLLDLWLTGPPMRDDWSRDSTPPFFVVLWLCWDVLRLIVLLNWVLFCNIHFRIKEIEWCCFLRMLDRLRPVTHITANKTTRSSATADGPRDAMCLSTFCQLLHNSEGTSCTTNRGKIPVMDLEGYSRPACNELCAFIHDSLAWPS